MKVESKLYLYIGGLVFFIFAALQINDIYGCFWIFAYLIPSLLSFVKILNYRFIYLKYLSYVYLCLSIYIYIDSKENVVMNIFSETINESLGMLCSAIWIFILSYRSVNLNIKGENV